MEIFNFFPSCLATLIIHGIWWISSLSVCLCLSGPSLANKYKDVCFISFQYVVLNHKVFLALSLLSGFSVLHKVVFPGRWVPPLSSGHPSPRGPREVRWSVGFQICEVPVLSLQPDMLSVLLEFMGPPQGFLFAPTLEPVTESTVCSGRSDSVEPVIRFADNVHLQMEYKRIEFRDQIHKKEIKAWMKERKKKLN